MNSNFLI